jgi:hypothetical protein
VNKFEPPLGGKSADPKDGVHRGSEQAQAGQPAPASFSGGEPTPPKPNYGTFFTVYPSDRRQSEAWAVSFVGILAGVFLAALGVLARDAIFAVASIMFAATFVSAVEADAGWSRGLVRLDMAPDGCVTVRPSMRLTVLRIVTVVCAVGGLVLYGLSLLVGAPSLLVRLGAVTSFALVALAGAVGRSLFSSPRQERIVLTENAVMLCGKDGVSYTIPWVAKPAVIAHRQRKTLLIKTDDDVECPISFAHLRIVPSRVKALLAYYQKNPEALDRLGTEESVDDALKGLGWYRWARRRR